MQAQQALFFGETPANLKACAAMDKADKGSCAKYHLNEAETYIKRVERALPRTGLVQILNFTDRQYETIVSFDGRTRESKKQNPQQYALF